MKAVILAAGKGTRMGDLTLEIPKPMLVVKGKTLLEHKLDNLPDSISEVVLVVGYLGHTIKNHLGDRYGRLPLHYVVQSELLGTGHALFEAQEAIGNDSFIVLMGDDLYSKADLEKMLSHKRAMLVQRTDKPVKGGLMKIEDGLIAGVTEGGELAHGHIYTGACLLNHHIFDAPLQKVTPTSLEFGLPQTMVYQRETHPIQAIEADFWIRITTPEDLERAEGLL